MVYRSARNKGSGIGLSQTASVSVYVGWCLFGIAFAILVSESTAFSKRMPDARPLLTGAGWLITIGMLLRRFAALHRRRRSGRLFRLFGWMNRLETVLAPLAAATATPYRRITLGVSAGVAALAVFFFCEIIGLFLR
jgi:hypothetical protein